MACLAVDATRGADWQADLTPPASKPLPLPRAVQVNYRFGWEKLPAAEATFQTLRLTNRLLQLKAEARSIGAVRPLWRFDLDHAAWSDEALRPQGFVQAEVYKHKTVKTNVSFDPGGLVRTSETLPPVGDGRLKDYRIAGALDPYSAFLLIRSQRLQPGDRYRVLVYPGLNLYLAEVVVEGPETVKVDRVLRKGTKLSLSLQHVTETMNLEPYGKFKRATIWLSDDEDRIPVKAEAEIFVGTVWAELRQAPSSP